MSTSSLRRRRAPLGPLQRVIAASALLGATAGARAAEPQAAAPASPAALSDAERVEAIVAPFLARAEAVGLSVAVARAQDLVFSRAYGFADLEFEVRADEDTLVRLGSVTKQFTAAAILRLQQRGKLNVDAELAEYVPEFSTQGHAVSVRQLLTHTSGVPSYTDLGRAWFDVVARELTHEELLALVAEKPLDFEPGTRFNYSNTGYYLLGMIVERVSGVPYGDFLAREFFEPLGLTRTRYDSNAEVIPNRAQGYGFADGKPQNDLAIGMSQPGGAGGLVSTAKDLVRWQLALVSGKVVDAAAYEEMTTPFMFPDGSETTYGFGLTHGELDGPRSVSHGGGIFGFNSFLAYYPDARLSVAVISNSESLSSGMVAGAIARDLLQPDAAARPQK